MTPSNSLVPPQGVADQLISDVDPLTAPTLRDRSAPGWARGFSYVFSLGTGICLLAIAVLTVFLQANVAEAGRHQMAPILLALAIIPLIGILIFEVAHARALAGYRAFRLQYKREADFILALFAGGVLAIVHPLLAAPLVLSMCLGFGLARISHRLFPSEPLWDFLPSEAVSILSGRDEAGRRSAASAHGENAVLVSLWEAISWGVMLATFAVGSWLVVWNVLALASVAPLALVAFWSSAAMGRFLRKKIHQTWPLEVAKSVTHFPLPEEIDAPETGLVVRNLNIYASDGQALLSDINFDVEPGQMIGITGEPGSGKSLLMKALVNPFDLPGLSIQGTVMMNGTALWSRSTRDQALPAVYMPPRPYLLPSSGANNLSCFHDNTERDRAEAALKHLLFSQELVDQITGAVDANNLSETQAKALSFARLFHLRPQLIMMDRPEDGANERLLSGVTSKLQQEHRLGCAVMMATETRSLQENCEMLLVLQNGRMVDFGQAVEIRERMQAGWLRFVADRHLDSEEPLDNWLNAQFRRDGDEANKRLVCMVANELLAFSCQDLNGLQSSESLRFEFKHFEGYCLLTLFDRGMPVSSGQLQGAREEADQAEDGARLSPLGKLYQLVEALDATDKDGWRAIKVRIATYDPRKTADRQVTDATTAA